MQEWLPAAAEPAFTPRRGWALPRCPILTAHLASRPLPCLRTGRKIIDVPIPPELHDIMRLWVEHGWYHVSRCGVGRVGAMEGRVG